MATVPEGIQVTNMSNFKFRGLVSVREAAAILKIDEHSVRRAIWRGAIRATKTNGHWRLPLHQVRQYQDKE